jgi:hypothetical protein
MLTEAGEHWERYARKGRELAAVLDGIFLVIW